MCAGYAALIVNIELIMMSFMLSCACSFVHFPMVKAIFSTEKSRTDLLIEDHLHCSTFHKYSQVHNVQTVNAKPSIFYGFSFIL